MLGIDFGVYASEREQTVLKYIYKEMSIHAYGAGELLDITTEQAEIILVDLTESGHLVKGSLSIYRMTNKTRDFIERNEDKLEWL